MKPSSNTNTDEKMADVQVTCITKNRNSTHDGITHLGGKNWKWSIEDVIASIEAETNTFYVSNQGSRINIGIANGPNRKHLRTHANGKWNDNLLSLPECP